MFGGNMMKNMMKNFGMGFGGFDDDDFFGGMGMGMGGMNMGGFGGTSKSVSSSTIIR
jgi:hypothetical protein